LADFLHRAIAPAAMAVALMAGAASAAAADFKFTTEV
jgi:hypothetical protein